MQPLLAFDIGSLFAVAFLLISFVGWIMNLINSQNPPPQPNRPARRQPPRDGKVQSEIEEFLQQAMGRRGQKAQPSVDTAGVEILEPPQAQPQPQRRPPAPRRSPPARPAASMADAAPAASSGPPAPRPGDGISSRHLAGSSGLGAGVALHVQDHLTSRVRREAEDQRQRSVEQSITQHLGEFRAGEADTRRDVAPVVRSQAAVRDPTGLINQLREPDGMRRAIILQEILNKPRSMRRR